mgnify:CR=1 FL=1
MQRLTASTTNVGGGLLVLLLVLFVFAPATASAARIKELASVTGVRHNQLVGYGLVVGLNGTGDGAQAAFTSQGLINMLENMGVHVNKENVKVKNVAGVMVTAKLPPFYKPGQSLDVVLSSLGDSSSLAGGTLIATPLKGLDGKVYAMAQGAVSVSGGNDQGHLTVGRIPNGASVEKGVPVHFADKEVVSLNLDNPDFTTVSRMVSVVNGYLGGEFARASDGTTVKVTIPEEYKGREIFFLADIEKLELEPDVPARVVLDERTGTVVMGENVRIGRIALSHGNLSLRIGNGVENTGAERLLEIDKGTSLGDVVRALNSVGVAPRDLIAIFQTIKASGSLQAELEII